VKKQKHKKLHKLLQLHQNKHTGKLLHHRHTSYRSLFLLIGIAAAFMVTMNHMAHAIDYEVTAIVPAPLPAGPATITNLKNGDTVYGPTIHISGVCPIISPAIIVVAYDNGTTLLGSQTCTSGGTFDLAVSLGTVGTHSITTTIMNFTGQVGASSPPLSISYIFGVVSTITKTTTSKQTILSTTPASQPTEIIDWPLITANSPFVIYAPGKDITWSGSFTRGRPPYAVSISWGDSSNQTGKNVIPGAQTFSHLYNTPGTYTVHILLKDAANHATTQMFTAICPIAFRTQPATTQRTPTLTNMLYATYLIVVAILARVWWRQRLFIKVQPAYARTSSKRQKPQSRIRR
jgi:hypothetical protein